jgi:integrase
VALYLTALAEGGRKASTITRRVSAISQAHQAAGHESPTKTAPVRAVLRGIRRTLGVAPQAKTPVLIEDLRLMVGALPEGLLGIRDRALLLIGFAGGFRRSELVSLNVGHVEFSKDGLRVTVAKSKTDQEGSGRKVGIPYGSHPETCPVRALRAWLEAARIERGALFRPINRHGQIQNTRLSDKAVALIVKRYADAIGKDASDFAGHSLRAGLATAAAIGGATERAIMAQTGHRSSAMVRRYIREGSLFRENAAAKVGL